MAALALLVCATCSQSASESTAAAAQNSPIAPGMARVVLYYPQRFSLIEDKLRITLNGRSSCDLKSGTYFVRDVQAGKQDLILSYCGVAKRSHVTLDAAAGKRYFLRVMPYDSSVVGILSGYPSDNVAPGEPAHTGPFEIKLVDEPEALAAMGSMKRNTGY